MATRIGEARRADSPRAIHRAVQQLHAAGCQLGTGCIHIVHRDRELGSRPGVRARDNSRLYEIARCRDLEQIDQGVGKSEYSGVLVLKDHREAEDLLVEDLRPLQVLHEKRDGIDALGRRIHSGAQPSNTSRSLAANSAAWLPKPPCAPGNTTAGVPSLSANCSPPSLASSRAITAPPLLATTSAFSLVTAARRWCTSSAKTSTIRFSSNGPSSLLRDRPRGS